ncbi:Dihydropyrimidinase-related protein 5 [Liparis tanakae]|uniref:Dihydropyrimidinase-related protein 5 n=1 Tax=Liparis tanakae TaxID=230148 RepID=A0A4Z2HB66_9TELE|nr:Dihydropyrimidinase-related protein 5 [Liparis tanakae]
MGTFPHCDVDLHTCLAMSAAESLGEKRNSFVFPLTKMSRSFCFCLHVKLKRDMSAVMTMAANMGSMRILIKGGKVVNDDFTQEADVGKELMIPGGAKVIDASGKLVLPGGIDTSVHLEQTFMNASIQDDFYSGTKICIPPSMHCRYHFNVSAVRRGEEEEEEEEEEEAALMGGTTMVMALVLPEQHCSLLDAYENCRALADAKACCDYALHVGVTWWGPKVRNEMETLVREHGVNSFQMYMAYKDTMMLRDSELYQTLQTCKDIGAIARVHAENGELVAEGTKEAIDLGINGPEGIEISRPEELESEATHRAVTIANRAHCPIYLVNVSSISAGDMVASAKMQGKVVHAETSVAHAVLNGMQYYHQDWVHAAAHVVVPPLRLDPNTPSYLMGLLANIMQRALGKDDFTKIPHGVAGVQDRMSVIWEKGVGGDFNLYEGMRCHGVPLVTISRGRLVCENDVFMCAEGSGNFYPQRTFPDFLYKKMVQREKTQAYKGVDRDAYAGDVAMVSNIMKKELGLGPIDGDASKGGPRPPHQGVRDLHESSFSLSGSQVDDHIPKRSSARILAPPGGRSSGIW